MARIANRDAGNYTSRREEFTGSNLYARWIKPRHAEGDGDGLYVVYSYGEHWPLYVYDDQAGRWYGNETKNSQSTGRHRSQAHPRWSGSFSYRNDVHWVDVERMVDIAREGTARVVAAILEG